MIGFIFKRTLPSGRITWGFSIDAGNDGAENGNGFSSQVSSAKGTPIQRFAGC
jgi:hypothetical protein